MAAGAYRFYPMKPQFMPLLLSVLVSCWHATSVSGQCQGDQQSLLLQLKQGLNYSTSYSVKLAGWSSSTECCKWPGITCDVGGLGRVIGLYLSDESIYGGLDNSSTLFSLEYLQVLDLSRNDFSTTIPSALVNLANLRYLNLSYAGFFGQIPADIARMRSLVELDFSMLYFPGLPHLKLENPNLSALVENLTQLTGIYLDGANISVQGNEWCQAIASSLPNLQVLSMCNCQLSGPIHSSLLNLQSLSVIRLDSNNFSSPVPDFFADFRNLTTLSLSFCMLVGTFPAKILQILSMEIIDQSNNKLLEGEFQEFPQNQYSMQTLILSDTNFSGQLPSSLRNLEKLSRMELASCNFSGTIPRSLENLTQLHYLDFSSNNFTGPIPSLGLSRNLVHLDLSYNHLSGDIPAQWRSFQKLEHVDLRHNSFNGSIPPSLFSIPSLQQILLSYNQLQGQAPEFSNATSLTLGTIDLSSNNLEGPIPRSIFEVLTLKELILSSNKFNGSIQLNWIQKQQNLTTLDLSYNNLTVDASGDNNKNKSTLPQLGILNMASSNLRRFPELGNQSRLTRLDLSKNNIDGVVPRWILESTTMYHLNLSHNNLVDFQVPISLPNLGVLDMHDNKLQGEIPVIRSSIWMTYVDYSNNLFNVSIPVEISNYLSFAFFFSLSNNRLRGAIPASICNASDLLVLDLSNNNLTGTIPGCLTENIRMLAVLNLRGNKLDGSIPDTFHASCSLQTLDLSWNQLHGRVPESMSNCIALKVLDLGNNRISDVFPCLLKNKPSLRVLILRNNLFHGSTGCPFMPGTWQKLQIIDLAFNNFSGPINGPTLSTWEAMMVGDGYKRHDQLKFEPFKFSRPYYQDSITVTSKGLQMQLVKVLTLFTSIDFSSNRFDGPIPEEIGRLGALHVLNFSHNAFTGQIPSVFRNLSQRESLDLSDNKLGGEIPQELTDLNFLSFLDLSNNNLIRKIPTASQFQTFENTSYEDNPGLCGSPLTKSCSNSSTPAVGVRHGKSGTGIHWTPLSIEFGFAFGLGELILPAAFWPSFRVRYWPLIDSLIVRMFPRLYQKDHKNRLKQTRRPRRRKQ